METKATPTIDLMKLVPRKATFKLSSNPDLELTLKPFSLASQIWLRDKFENERAVQEFFEKRDIPNISKVVYYQLEEKNLFPTELSFFEAVLGLQDQLVIMHTLLQCVGFSNPQIDEITEAAKLPPKTQAQSANRAKRRAQKKR